MKNLRQLLMIPEVVDGIISNLGELCRIDVEDLVNKAMSNPGLYHGKSVSGDHILEYAMSYDRSAHKYLLEVRLFHKDDKMINAYLEVFNEDLSFDGNTYDDVFESFDWEALCICTESDCILSGSSTLLSGSTVFSDLRLDLDNNQLDIEHGLLGDDGYAAESSWTNSLDINYCFACGRKLD